MIYSHSSTKINQCTWISYPVMSLEWYKLQVNILSIRELINNTLWRLGHSLGNQGTPGNKARAKLLIKCLWETPQVVTPQKGAMNTSEYSQCTTNALHHTDLQAALVLHLLWLAYSCTPLCKKWGSDDSLWYLKYNFAHTLQLGGNSTLPVSP